VSAGFVEQQFIELGLDLEVAAAESVHDALNDLLEIFLPGLAADLERVGGELACAAHVRVVDGLLAPAVGCFFGGRGNISGLRGEQGEGEGADALDLNGRQRTGPIT
jgi:hypothetical protein